MTTIVYWHEDIPENIEAVRNEVKCRIAETRRCVGEALYVEVGGGRRARPDARRCVHCQRVIEGRAERFGGAYQLRNVLREDVK